MFTNFRFSWISVAERSSMADSYNYPWSPKRGRYMYSLPWELEGAGRKGASWGKLSHCVHNVASVAWAYCVSAL